MDAKLPLLGAFQRPCWIDLDAYPALRAAWTRSQRTLERMSQSLAESQLHSAVEVVAVSGSMGRMEQIEFSDTDLIVILNTDRQLDSVQTDLAYQSVWQALHPLSLNQPRSYGIYATATSRSQLLDPSSLGQIDEAPAVFGKRIQMLLDSQPIFGEAIVNRLQQSILNRHAPDNADVNPSFSWQSLTNELIRYFRSLSVYYAWNARDEPQKWRHRNVKLRHSRLLMYSGLLLLLGQSQHESSQQEASKWVADRLRLTPLERVAWVYSINGDANFGVVARHYEQFLNQMQDPSFRQNLAREPVRNDDDVTSERLTESTSFQDIQRNAHDFQTELMRFLNDRRQTWPDSFFDCLFF